MNVWWAITSIIISYGKFEDTERVIRSRKSKTDRQHNGRKKKDKRTNNDQQNMTQKIKFLHGDKSWTDVESYNVYKHFIMYFIK
jgi:hypothetical protein